MRTFLFSLFLGVCSVTYAQIPVTDAAMNANTIGNQITNAATWGNQLLKLKEQASILTTTLKFVTDVSTAIRDASYAKSLIERQRFICKSCENIINRAKGLDIYLVRNIETNVAAFLSTNNSLITLINSTLTSRFKMNDSERLKTLMDVKKEQDSLLETLYTTDMILTTVMTTNDIIDYQLLK